MPEMGLSVAAGGELAPAGAPPDEPEEHAATNRATTRVVTGRVVRVDIAAGRSSPARGSDPAAD
jgi:hypothetical protein